MTLSFGRKPFDRHNGRQNCDPVIWSTQSLNDTHTWPFHVADTLNINRHNVWLARIWHWTTVGWLANSFKTVDQMIFYRMTWNLITFKHPTFFRWLQFDSWFSLTFEMMPLSPNLGVSNASNVWRLIVNTGTDDPLVGPSLILMSQRIRSWYQGYQTYFKLSPALLQNAYALVPGMHFHPSLTFAGEARDTRLHSPTLWVTNTRIKWNCFLGVSPKL